MPAIIVSSGIARRTESEMRYCPLHLWPVEESLGCCLHCLIAEVDPPDSAEASWWWRKLYVCRCRRPDFEVC